jgi:flagellar hook-associated protein 2
MQLEALPIQRLQFQRQAISTRQGVFSQLKSRLTTLSTAAGALNSTAAFNPVSANSSDPAVATVSATAGAGVGTFSLTVGALAQGHKISSAAKQDLTSALGQSGKFTINGKMVEVVATDSLSAVAEKINSLNAGVSATLVNGGTGNAYMTLTSTFTGAASRLQLADVSGAVLGTGLGFVTGTAVVRDPIPGGARTYGFSSSTSPIATLQGDSEWSPVTIRINNHNVTIDPSADSLETIAGKIQAAHPSLTAKVKEWTVDGKTVHGLEIVSSTGSISFTDSQGFLASIGVLQRPVANQVTGAQDASYTLEGVALTSPKNTLSDVLPGVTINLLKTTSSGAVTLSLTRDTSAVKAKVKEFLEAFNGVADFIKEASQFDKETFRSGPLFSDPTALQIDASLADLVLRSVPGLSGQVTNLSSVGFSFTTNGKLSFDESRFDQALIANPSAVESIFRAVGSASGASLSFVSNTSKSKPGVYDVVITHLATQASLTAAQQQNSTSKAIETLTFGGSAFGGSTYDVQLPSGSSQADTVARINSDPKLKDILTASVLNGRLVLTAKRYGAPGQFTVVSDRQAHPSNSGIGNPSGGPQSTYLEGKDIEGTIGGEEATGHGQFLTGKAGNSNTDGLQVYYTGTSLGLVGNVRLTRGIASQMSDLIGSFTDTVNGLLTATDQSLQAQVDALGDAIKDLESRLIVKQEALRLRFSRMEEAMAKIQSQAARLAAIQPMQAPPR